MATTDAHRALRVLGLGSGASADEVKAAYRDMAQVWHPDRFADNPRLREKAARNLQRINDAYAVLKDYAPPVGAAARPSRDSISVILGLGDLRESAAFRAPMATLRSSLRVLRVDPSMKLPRARRNFWWIVLTIAGGVGLILALFVPTPG